MTEAEQFQRLRTWLRSVTGIPEIILESQQGERPPGLYATLNLSRSDRIGGPDDVVLIERDGATGEEYPFDEVPIEEWEYVWSFNIYGAEGAAWAARAISATRSGSALSRLHPLSLHSTSGVRPLREFVNERWEPRAQIDLNVRAIVRHGFDADVIEAVPATLNDDSRVIPALPISEPPPDPPSGD